MRNPQSVSQWRRVPAGRARSVAQATSIPLHELRPDLWDPPAANDDTIIPPPGGAAAHAEAA
ncbi:protein of unknown function (plasmid) [Rhodovastum atsumiense]|nr:protein of unknown function [Rhodovastum atsumiense]